MKKKLKPNTNHLRVWVAIIVSPLIAGLIGNYDGQAFESKFITANSGIKIALNAVGSNSKAIAKNDIVVKGSTQFKIKYKEKGVRFYWQQATYKVVKTDKDIRIKLGDKGLQYRLKDKGGKWNLYKNDDTLRYRIQRQGKNIEVFDAANNRLYRTKIKETSFNLYGPENKRIQKGKQKEGKIIVRSKVDEQKMLTIEGITDLAQASIFAIPIAPPFLVLIHFASQ